MISQEKTYEEQRFHELLEVTRDKDFALLNKGGNEGFTKLVCKLIHKMDNEKGVGAKLDHVLEFLETIPKLEKMKKYADIRDTIVRENVLLHLEWILKNYGLEVRLSYWGLEN